MNIYHSPMSESAVAIMAARKSLRDGPYFTGNTPHKGVTFREDDREVRSTVKRFTDRYTKFRTVGITSEQYQAPYWLPTELKEFIGLDATRKSNGQAKKTGLELSDIRLMQDEEQKPKDDENGEGNEDDESAPEELEDEFEEFEDDDYNAEKYFDDGDGDGMGDDDDGEAAY